MEFLSGEDLAEEIYDTIYKTEKYLFILSPFIRLDDYFKKNVFETHKNNSSVHIIIGFGKNEDNVNKSFSKEDIEYFLDFPFITIIYIPNLHAKYYGNENKSIITSMNLLEYSFQNNIEFGVLSEKKTLSSNTFFKSAQDTCINVLDDFGYTIFINRPKFKKKLFGRDYVGTENDLDIIEDIIANKNIERIPFSGFMEEKFVNVALKGERIKRTDNTDYQNVVVSKKKPNQGHCIRCKDNIGLNLNYPLCSSCYSTWVIFGDPYYIEKYCISCGKKESSSYAKPACYSCFSEISKYNY